MPKQRKNVILVFLVLLTSIAVLCIAIVTVMLMGSPPGSTVMAATPLGSPPGSTPTAMTPQELLVSSNIEQRFAVLSKASTDYCSNIGNRAAIYADMANMPQDSYLQGSCCSLMDMTHYKQQITALKAYASCGTVTVEVNPHGTSQYCSRCGAKGERFSSRSGQRIREKWGKLFACPSCQYEANADFNASVNVHRSFYREWHWQKRLKPPHESR